MRHETTSTIAVQATGEPPTITPVPPISEWAQELGPLQQGDVELLEDAIEALLQPMNQLQRGHALHGLQKRVAAAKQARAGKTVMQLLGEVDDHLQGLQHYGHSHLLREAMGPVQDMQDALAEFVKQWNACGPNSDFGRIFQRVNGPAIAALRNAGVA